MIRIQCIILFFCILTVSFAAPAFSSSAENPLVYPDNEPVKTTPVPFFWQDIRNTEGTPSTLLFRLTIDSKTGKDHFEKKSPALLSKGFFLMYWDSPLAFGDYHFSIDLMDKDKAPSSKFYGFRKYPLKGDFSVTANEPMKFSAEEFIMHRQAVHYNLLENGYNALFYGGSSSILIGSAVLLLTVFDYNIYTRIAAYVCGSAGSIGLGATGYYSYRYLTFDETKFSLSLSPTGKEKSYAVAASVQF